MVGRFTAGFAVCAILYGGPPHVGSPFHMMLQLALQLIGGDETPPPTLNYFDARGRGEAIRLAFADNGVKFKENAFSSELWGKERDDGLKAIWTAAGRLPFGQVPLLTGGDYDTRGNWTSFELVQSHAILRYIGRRGSWDGLRYTPGYYEGRYDAGGRVRPEHRSDNDDGGKPWDGHNNSWHPSREDYGMHCHGNSWDGSGRYGQRDPRPPPPGGRYD